MQKIGESDDTAKNTLLDLADMCAGKKGSRVILGSLRPRTLNGVEHEVYCNKEGNEAAQIFSVQAYQVIAFYRHAVTNFPELIKNPTSKAFKAAWDQIFKNGSGLHCRHLCQFEGSSAKCTKCVIIGTRKENEEDKHWHYFYYHPQYGTRFREWLAKPENEDIQADCKTRTV